MARLDIQEIKNRLEEYPEPVGRMALIYTYETASRLSEVCGKYAIKGSDCSTTSISISGERVNIVLFTIQTAKRHGIQRIVALPLDQKYDKWSQELREYFLASGNQKAFQFCYKTLENYATKCFQGLTYPIMPYLDREDEKRIQFHDRKAVVHYLRHARLTELTNVYGFNSDERHVFAGWSLGENDQRYVVGEWSMFLPKLLKEVRP